MGACRERDRDGERGKEAGNTNGSSLPLPPPPDGKPPPEAIVAKEELKQTDK